MLASDIPNTLNMIRYTQESIGDAASGCRNVVTCCSWRRRKLPWKKRNVFTPLSYLFLVVLAPHGSHAVQRCGHFLRMSHIVWSLCDEHTTELCKTGWTNRYAVPGWGRAGTGPQIVARPPNLAVLLTHCSQLIFRKTSKFDAIRCQILC